MNKKQHSSDEFGQQPLGAVRGMDASMIGAPTNVILDGIVEAESGKTPPPPPFSVRTAVITLALIFAMALILLFVTTRMSAGIFGEEAVRPQYEVVPDNE